MEELKVTPEPIVEPVTEPIVEEVVETKPLTQTELKREISKELGINLFDVNGLAEFKKFQESQKTAQEKLNEQVETFKTKEAEWETEKLGYQAKLKASELGIKADALEDVLKLANGNPDNLVEVIKKYPIFKATDGVRIGVQDPSNSTPPGANTEAEEYMAKNPLYKKYNKK